MNPHYQQQLYLRPSFIVFFSLSHKWPMFAFTSESGYTLGFRRKIAHKGTHGETGGVLGGGWYHYPRSVPHVSETLRGQGVERQTLPLLGLGGGALEERRKPSEQRCAHARRCSEASRPRWAARLCCSCFDLLRRGHFRRWRRPPRTRTRPGPCGYRCGCRPAFCGDWRRYSPRPSGCPRCPGPTRRKTDPPWKA